MSVVSGQVKCRMVVVEEVLLSALIAVLFRGKLFEKTGSFILPARLWEMTRLTGEFEQTLRQDTLSVARAREKSVLQTAPPRVIPGYEFERILGEGAYGTVWLAREKNTGKKVAIKFFHNRHGLDWSLLSREVEKLAVLYTSRNIVALQEVGWDSEPPYFIMEYLEHGSLADKLKDGPMSVADAVTMARSIAVGLLHAHRSGILHCDLKPANVLLDQNDEPRLCDFGQSRMAEDHQASLGTLYYMAPEQADLKAVPDMRWDVYALGVILFTMLSGKPPHFSEEFNKTLTNQLLLETRLDTYRKHLFSTPLPDLKVLNPKVDRALKRIIERCLALDVSDRYESIQAVVDALDERASQRARRPFIVLSILGPIILMLALFPVARSGIGMVMNRTQQALAQRALDGDAISAGLLGINVARELDDRTNELVRFADDPRLRAAILNDQTKPWADRTELRGLVDGWKETVKSQRDKLNRPMDTSWFVTDRPGRQIYRDPATATIDYLFNFRDYYHGHGIEYDPQMVPESIEPIRQPYVSQVFKSNASGKYMIAISVPVWDEKKKDVIGVLARTAHLSELLTEWERSIVGEEKGLDSDRIIALVDTRDGKILGHPWMTTENLTTLLASGAIEKLTVDEHVLKELKKLHDFRPDAVLEQIKLMNYEDPLSEFDAVKYAGPWMAVISPVGDTGWAAVVQERQSSVLQPVSELQTTLIQYALAAIIMAMGTTAVIVYLLIPSIKFWERK